MTITESTRRQLFSTSNRLQVIRMDQKRHAAPQLTRSSVALGTWTVEEHRLFLEALDLYPSGPWKRVAQHVGSRTPRQVMTHAQKYRQRLQRRVDTPSVEPAEASRTASKETQTSKVLSVVVSPMPTAVATDEIQVEADICVLPAVFADEPPAYGHFPPFFDEFLAQLATDSMFDGVDMTLPYADIEPLQI
ncbi:Myb-like DNA-binding protein [Phytophthora megakarya]|uniref:Myb-like DNA-binding protein n=1 Tax=Phytophthora megakarya TaxID=4795 RepID=A0A225X0L5_9STRA|nr:Myb-like DNA-binding protein [Phytophthora megakarya]